MPHKREKKTFWALIVSAFANIVLNFIFIPFWGINGAAVTTVIAEGLVVLISARESRDIFNFRGCLGVTISVLTGCAGILLVCLAINYFNLSLIPDTLLKMALSVLVYFAILLIAKNEIVLEMVNAFKAKVSKKKA